MDRIGELLPVIVPLLAIQLALIAFALNDLTRPGRSVRGGSKGLWAVVIIVINLIGPVLYFTLGRQEA